MTRLAANAVSAVLAAALTLAMFASTSALAGHQYRVSLAAAQLASATLAAADRAAIDG